MIKRNIIIGSVIVVLILFLTLVSYRVNGFLNTFLVDTEKLGHFGDFIGGFLGVLLTAIATVLIYLTYDSQKNELELSREMFSKQGFENTYFNMLKVHQDLRMEIQYKSNPVKSWCPSSEKANNYSKDDIVIGKTLFIYLENEFRCLWKYENPVNFEVLDTLAQKHNNYGYKYETHPSYKEIDPDGQFVNHSVEEHLKHIIELKYDIFWKKYANYLGDYFRNIYHILKFLSDEKKEELVGVKGIKVKIKIKDKYKKYADILQSQLSFSELFLIFYNALSFPKMKEFVDEFDFIENLHINNLLHPKHAEFKGIGKIKRD